MPRSRPKRRSLEGVPLDKQWVCPRCGDRMQLMGKGGHIRIHVAEQCEVTAGCTGKGQALRRDGRMSCWLCLTKPATKALAP